MTYRILLYYHYVDIEYPEEVRDAQFKFCEENNLKGRIIIAHEGINGTVSGTIEDTQKYIDFMNNHPMFKSMPFKIDMHDSHAFPRLRVRVRPELVNLSLDKDIDPLETTGNHLKPEEFYEYMQMEDTVILDARNDYEYDLGHFRNAIRPDIKNFRDLPEWIQENKEVLEDKRILTYCTGGVRCEKFSGWLKEEGFEDVHQLDGGIATYGYDSKVAGAMWDGLMYVFDDRISVPINRHEHTIVGKDYFDGSPCERYVNCAEPTCNRKMICSEENEAKYLRACSHECRISKDNRYVQEHNMSEDEVQEALSQLNN